MFLACKYVHALSLTDSQCGSEVRAKANDDGAPPKKKRKRVAESPPVVEEPAPIASPTMSDEPITGMNFL